MSQTEETLPPESAQPAPAARLPEPHTLYRIRVKYARREELRYVSHLDMQLVWERTLRRASLPLAYTKGFNPNPRLHQASALPLGFLSQAEITDFWLETDQPPDLEALASQVQFAAPPGLVIRSIDTISLQSPALQTLVTAAEYTAAPLDPLDSVELENRVIALLGMPSLPRERRGKAYDLRLLIESLAVEPAKLPALHMRLAAREGATGRPEEVLLALGLDPAGFRVERTALILAEN